MKKQIDEHEADLQELVETLFHRADEELEGYKHEKRKCGEDMAKIQHERFLGIYGVIEDSGYKDSFNEYRKRLRKERKK